MHAILQNLDNAVLQMVKRDALLKCLQRGLTHATTLAYADNAPDIGSGIEGFNERMASLQAKASSQAFAVDSGQTAPVDPREQMEAWKGLAQSFEGLGVFNKDGTTPTIVDAFQWRLSQDRQDSSEEEADAISKASQMSAATIKKMRDQSALRRYQHRAMIGECAVENYLSAESNLDLEPVGWSEVWDDIKGRSEASLIRISRDADELINDLWLLNNS